MKSRGQINIIIKDIDYVNKKMLNKINIENINEKDIIFYIRMAYEIIIVKLKVN